MKRILSVILAAIMMISAFCFTAYATEETPKADALLDRFETEDEVLVTLKSGKSKLLGFMSSDVKNTIAVRDDTVTYEYSTGFIKIRVLAKDTGIYAFLPTLPYFYVKLDVNPFATVDIWEFVKQAANLTQGFTRYIDSYTETVDGKEYYVEEYDDREFVTSKFYFDGDDLKILKVEDSSTKSVQYTYFDEISFDVDNSYFRIPTGAFDATPFLAGIILAIIATA